MAPAKSFFDEYKRSPFNLEISASKLSSQFWFFANRYASLKNDFLKKVAILKELSFSVRMNMVL